MKNLDLLNKALEVTTKNVTKKRGSSNRITTNDRLLKLLFGDDKEALTRVEIVNHITYQRMEEKLKRELIDEDFENEQFLIDWAKLSKTVKNSVDTSISKSNNNASFHYNEKYNDYLMVITPENKYKVILKESKNEPTNEQPPTSKKTTKRDKKKAEK